MGLEFINRVAKTSIYLGLIQLPFVILYWGWQIAFGILLGCGWGAANLILIKFITTGALSDQNPNKTKILILGAIKFPLLYGIGYLLLKVGYFPPESLVIGFTIIFLVAFLKAVGIYLLDKNVIGTQKSEKFEGNNAA
ncbi:MAG: hypothetical protein GY855_12530 [candidate division Zixibacteria bacterium]|nr:hypothetical protein [candidate division Zixibacteria bacterium]